MKSTDHMDQKTKEMVHLFVTGELDENEHKEVFDWVSSSPGNRRYYNGLRAALRAAEYFSTERKYNFERVHSRLNTRIDPVTDISWKDKEWVIRGKTMEEMSVMLERRYNVEIVLGDGVVGSFRFSGTLKDETLEQVLFAIRSTAPVDYKIDGKKIVLTDNKALRRRYEKILKGNT